MNIPEELSVKMGTVKGLEEYPYLMSQIIWCIKWVAIEATVMALISASADDRAIGDGTKLEACIIPPLKRVR